ncbi:unnamed protein product [Rhizoctonia solani]|uniref:Methyltransferase domain-containing protein n=1 Tax=Rhizoctonia solani TaxID=456999 RepID=A0A8H2WUB2_9AGAM|nr:unnamed protein product [Rhizoctonia solani]
MKAVTSSPSPAVIIRHGRQFHKTGSNYGLPNDEGEYTRLNYQNDALKMMLGANYSAPLKHLNSGEGPLDVLDVASGSGIWVMEIAHEFPKARVVGMDMSEPEALGGNIPPNASFVIADITRKFPFEDQSFDVVQMRIVPSIHERTLIYKEIHRVLRPGGLIQLVEPSPHTSRVGCNPPAMDETDRAIIRCGHKSETNEAATQQRKGSGDQDWSMGNRIASDLRDAPWMWTSIHETIVIVPIGVWTQDEISREAGRLMQHCAVELIKGFRPNLIDDARFTGEEVDGMISRLTNELEDGSRWQLEAPFHFIWAAKAC